MERLDFSSKDAKVFLPEGELDRLYAEAYDTAQTLNRRAAARDPRHMLGWLRLAEPENKEEMRRLLEIADKIRGRFETVALIGIGGSYLGARAAEEFLRPQSGLRGCRLRYLGCDLSAGRTARELAALEEEDFCLCVVSKSGGTLEPAAAYRLVRALAEKKYGAAEADRRTFVVTGRGKGALAALAEEKNLCACFIPEDVGGRYSVLSPAGLLPMAAAGIDVIRVLCGAAEMQTRCFEPQNSPAVSYAACRSGLYRNGKGIELLSFFEPKAAFFGEWWKQLFGESEGKGGRGLFPAVCRFTADLHSMGQYIQQGPRSLCETFLLYEHTAPALPIPESVWNGDGLDHIAGMDMAELNRLAAEATVKAHRDGDVPCMRVTVRDMEEESFGALVMFFEISCALSAMMLGVDPFDQPGVEAYKKELRHLLG